MVCKRAILLTLLNVLQWNVIFCDATVVSYSGIVEEDMVLSLQQTVPEKTVEKEEELQVEQEDKSVMDMMKLFKKDPLTCSVESPKSLYEKLKDKPEALTVLAPAAGDTIISLDFDSPG